MERMTGTEKIRAFYEHRPCAPFFKKEFYYLEPELWVKQGHVKSVEEIPTYFNFDTGGVYSIRQLGWTSLALFPAFEVKELEDVDETKHIIQDKNGRRMLMIKGKLIGFMPEYIGHPVTDEKSWHENVEWRLDPTTPERIARARAILPELKKAEAAGRPISLEVIGGFMYLRVLLGPQTLLYTFYDDPDLIHTLMRHWLKLADSVSAIFQEEISFDEIFLAEDICYKSSSLISPDMIRAFLFPYYQQLIANIRARQKDKGRRLHIQIDTDGHAEAVLDLYREGVGMDYMSPFEVAAGCDVVEIRKKYPDLLISGGFDKRILAQGKEAIDRECDRILPFMFQHGGYLPTCDHSVPAEVSFENYVHFRRRIEEYSC